MKLRSGVNVFLFYFVSAIGDNQTSAAVAPDNRTETSEQSSLTASPASSSSSPTGFGTSRFGTLKNFKVKLVGF